MYEEPHASRAGAAKHVYLSGHVFHFSCNFTAETQQLDTFTL